MAKMAKLSRAKADREEGHPEDDGAHLHLDHHHLKAMGVHGNVEAGRKVHIRARGVVKHSSSSQDEGGEKRKSLHLHLTHMHMEHGESPQEEREESPEMERAELRSGIEDAYQASEKKKRK